MNGQQRGGEQITFTYNMFIIFSSKNTAIKANVFAKKKLQKKNCLFNKFIYFSLTYSGSDSSVGIANGYGMDGPGIEYRWGARIFAHVQTGPGAHATSCTVGTGSFPEVESDRGLTLTTYPLLVQRSKNRVSYTSTLPKGLRGL
jgi:hypothetical protein